MPDVTVPQTDDILRARGPKKVVDERVPYGFFVEPEIGRCGDVADVATLLLTNRECPLRCLMCDLWQNTTDRRVTDGAIPDQIAYALDRLPTVKRIKLYNSGNFFDTQAIPVADHLRIAELVRPFETVVIENHPRLINESCLRFRDTIDGELEVAMGLETIHPQILPRLNKQMTLDDFARATEFLVANDITVRTFILLRPPWLNEVEGVEWAIRAVEYAFGLGVNCCAVVPTRAGNGVMEQLQTTGDFHSPSIHSMERVMHECLPMKRGRVLMDLWDADRFCECTACADRRIERLRLMNLNQSIDAEIRCGCQSEASK
jgi:radical SAM enzyme (TIGR01210 family)